MQTLNLLQCDGEDCDSDCNGGLMNTAFDYTLKTGGLVRKEEYTRIDSTCMLDKSKIAASISSFSVIFTDENQISANLVKHRPVAVGINVDYMQTYVGGLSCPSTCSGRLDYGVLLVGYGSGSAPYWIVKNSWGDTWGEKGYYKLCKGQGECGIDSLATMVSATTTSLHHHHV